MPLVPKRFQAVGGVLLFSALLASIPSAQANIYTYTYTGDGVGGSLTITDNALNQITAVSGDITSPTPGVSGAVTTFTQNPNGSGRSTSPSGYFYYDDVLYPNTPSAPFDNYGLLILAANGNEVNIFSGPMTEYENNGFNTLITGTLTPEPGFYGLLALGLSGLVTVVSRRRKASKA